MTTISDDTPRLKEATARPALGACTRARKRLAFAESSILSPDVVTMILSHLDHAGDVVRASRVCTTWRRCAADDLVWSRVFAENAALRGEVEDTVRARTTSKAFVLGMAAAVRPRRLPYALSPRDFSVLVSVGDGGEPHACSPTAMDGDGSGAVVSCPMVSPATLPVGHEAMRSALKLRVDLVRLADGAVLNLASDWRATSHVFDDGNGGAISLSWEAHPVDALSNMTAHATVRRTVCNFDEDHGFCPCTPCMLQSARRGASWELLCSPVQIRFDACASYSSAPLPLCGPGGMLDLFAHVAGASLPSVSSAPLAAADLLLIVNLGGRAVAVAELLFADGEFERCACIDLAHAPPGRERPFLYEASPRARACRMMHLRVDALRRADGRTVTVFHGEASSVLAAVGENGEFGWMFEWNGWSTGERARLHPLCRVSASLFVAEANLSGLGINGDFSTLAARFSTGCPSLAARELRLTFHADVPSQPLPPPEWASVSARSSAQVLAVLAQAFRLAAGAAARMP